MAADLDDASSCGPGVPGDCYDAIYAFKDYAEEAAAVDAVLQAEGVAKGAHLLDAGCGTGRHLVHLRSRYRVSGFDLDPALLATAREKLPGADLFLADLTDFDVAEPVDAIVCLFGSIGYVHPEPRLKRCLQSFHRALQRGGVLMIEPWLSPDQFAPGRPMLQSFDGDDLKVTRCIASSREGPLSCLRFHWLVARPGAEDVAYYRQVHRLWLLPVTELLASLHDAGWDASHRPLGDAATGRGLIVARKR